MENRQRIPIVIHGHQDRRSESSLAITLHSIQVRMRSTFLLLLLQVEAFLYVSGNSIYWICPWPEDRSNNRNEQSVV